MLKKKFARKTEVKTVHWGARHKAESPIFQLNRGCDLYPLYQPTDSLLKLMLELGRTSRPCRSAE